MSMTPIAGFKWGIFHLQCGPCGLGVQDVAKNCAIVWRFRWVQGVWSKNSSTLAASKILKFFNADEYKEGARDRLQCDRFVIENFPTDRIHRNYRFNRIRKTLAFS